MAYRSKRAREAQVHEQATQRAFDTRLAALAAESVAPWTSLDEAQRSAALGVLDCAAREMLHFAAKLDVVENLSAIGVRHRDGCLARAREYKAAIEALKAIPRTP